MTPPRRATRAASAGLRASGSRGERFPARRAKPVPPLDDSTTPRRAKPVTPLDDSSTPRRGKSGPALPIRLLVLDVDGVLTDGCLHYGPRGELMKSFHVRDGHGIKALRAAGVDVAVVSGRRSAAVGRRCRELGIRYVIQGVDDKLAAFGRLAARLGVQPAECACIGDDEPDVPLMRAVGLAYAVADAHPAALRAAHRTTSLHGGRGAVREVCDHLIGAVRRLDGMRRADRARDLERAPHLERARHTDRTRHADRARDLERVWRLERMP